MIFSDPNCSLLMAKNIATKKQTLKQHLQLAVTRRASNKKSYNSGRLIMRLLRIIALEKLNTADESFTYYYQLRVTPEFSLRIACEVLLRVRTMLVCRST